ncbi:hypothetical protein SNEBB_002186 [Seison nebaliae]|nr:hypothetical protein SNEBB_002186 [Seison nebaliae]
MNILKKEWKKFNEKRDIVKKEEKLVKEDECFQITENDINLSCNIHIDEVRAFVDDVERKLGARITIDYRSLLRSERTPDFQDMDNNQPFQLNFKSSAMKTGDWCDGWNHKRKLQEFMIKNNILQPTVIEDMNNPENLKAFDDRQTFHEQEKGPMSSTRMSSTRMSGRIEPKGMTMDKGETICHELLQTTETPMINKHQGSIDKIVKDSESADTKGWKDKRLIGEICFQLDRRILQYIFGQRERWDKKNNVKTVNCQPLYGYSTKCLLYYIGQHSINIETGFFDDNLYMENYYRYCYLFRSLIELKYDESIHPQFCHDLINEYNVLPKYLADPQQSLAELRAVLASLCRPEDKKNILVVFDCLLFMSLEDKERLFLY